MNLEQFLSVDDLETKEVDVPGFGVVFIRELSAIDRVECSKRVRAIDEDDQIGIVKTMATFIAFSVVDDEGKTNPTDENIDRIARKKMATLEKIYTAVCDLNGIGRAAEELEKNSETSQG